MSTVVVMTKKGKQSRAEIQRNYRIKKLLLDPEAARLKERERWRRPWSMVHGPWPMVDGPWYWSVVYGPCYWSMVQGPWSMGNDAWSMVLVHGQWSMVN